MNASAPVLPEVAGRESAPRERSIEAAVRESLGDVPVLLCGSRATGTHRPLSDYDVLVVLPWRRMPFAVKKLRALSAGLTQTVGVPVTVNPVPERRLRRRVNLFLWKVGRDGRLLSSPPGFTLPCVASPPHDDNVRFSCLMSALQELLRGAGGDARRRDDAARKALLMLAQIRLLERGSHAVTLDEALAVLEADGCGFVELLETPDCWTQTCAKVLADLRTIGSPDSLTALRVNVRYAILALLRGRWRLRPALSPRAIDRRLAGTAALLAGVLVDGTAEDHAAIHIVHGSLPRSLRRRTPPTWEGVRSRLEEEWPDAHPLIAQ